MLISNPTIKVKVLTFSMRLFVFLFLMFPSFAFSINSVENVNRKCVVIDDDLYTIDDLIHQGSYYKALDDINILLASKIKDEKRLRLQIRKSIVLIDLSKAKEAESMLTSVNERLKKRKFRKSEAQFEVIYAMAKLEFFKGHYLDSELTFLKALNLNCDFPKKENSFYSDVLSELGLAYLLIGKYKSSDSILTLALSDSKIQELEKAKIEEQFSYLYYEEGKFQKADSIIQICKKRRSDILGVNHHFYADILEFEGSVFEHYGKTIKADSVYNIIYDIRKSYFKDDHVSLASSLNSLASVLWIKGENEKAVEIYYKALAIRKKLQGKLHPEYVTLLNNIAVSYVMLGKFNEGLEIFLRVKEILKKTLGVDNPEYGTNLNNLAFTYFKLGEYRKTKDIYLEALEFREKKFGTQHPDYVATLNNIALLYDKLGEVENAETSFIRCKNLIREHLGVEYPLYAKILNNLASVYLGIGDFKKCEESYNESLFIYEKLNGKMHTTYATVKSNLGILYKSMGDLERAQKNYTETVNILKEVVGEKHELYASALGNLGLIELNLGNISKAEKNLIESNQTTLETLGEEHVKYAISQANLASLYQRKKEYQLAEELFLNALEIEKNQISSTSDTYLKTLKSTVNFYNAKGDFKNEFLYAGQLIDTQIGMIENGLDFMSEDQKFTFKKNLIGDFSYAKKLMLKADDPSFIEKMYNLCLYEKGLLLNSSISTRKYVFAQNDKKIQDKFIELNDLKTQLLKDIQANKVDQLVVDKIDSIEKDLAKASAYYRDQQAFNKIDVAQIKKALNPDEIAVEFTFFKHGDVVKYAALILDPNKDNVEFVPLFDQSELTASKQLSKINYVNALYSEANESIKIRNREITPLYRMIWQPLMPYFENVSTIYYAGSGLLQRINLSALPFNANLIMSEKFNMENLLSTRNIIKKESENDYDNTYCIVGGVNYNTDVDNQSSDEILAQTINDRSLKEYWDYLPYSKVEAEEISATLRDKNYDVTFWSEAFASESNFKKIGTQKNSPRLLHLATHGFAFSDPNSTTLVDSSVVFKIAENPMLRSGLVLSGANLSWKSQGVKTGEDGILTAFEVANMNLTNTELVVLSACETGLGEISGNEGVLGLQRAFKKAGAKYLIMSLWKIPDEETSEFMTSFYNAWHNKNLSIQEAFKQTQIEMKTKHFDPYKWAGFVLIE